MYELAPDYMGLFAFSRRGSHIADSGAEVNSSMIQRQGTLACTLLDLSFRAFACRYGLSALQCCVELLHSIEGFGLHDLIEGACSFVFRVSGFTGLGLRVGVSGFGVWEFD